MIFRSKRSFSCPKKHIIRLQDMLVEEEDICPSIKKYMITAKDLPNSIVWMKKILLSCCLNESIPAWSMKRKKNSHVTGKSIRRFAI